MNGRIVIASLFLLGGLGVAVAGASPQATLTPSEATVHSPGEVSVKGTIHQVDRANATFELRDEHATLEVRASGTLPAAVQSGKALVAEGQLIQEEGERILLADEIQLGCPSTYEA